MPECKKCGSDNIVKQGIQIRTNHKNQQYLCKDCKHQWSLKIEVPLIEGITADERVDFEDEIMPYLKKIGARAISKNEAEANQSIIMPTGAFAIALMSDLHAGGKSDYEAIEKDVNIISSTDGMYVINVGDNMDNFIIGKLQSIQKEQPTTFDMEYRFIEWLLKKLREKIVAWVSGNHENWTTKLSGIDIIRENLKGTKCLYSPVGTIFNLKWGDNSVKIKVRHKWRGSSIFNPTHAIECGWERGGDDFDIGIGGHTHIATLCRSFIREGKKKYAVLLGTYKIRDGYGMELGFAKSVGTGSGAFVFHPTGRFFWCEDLETARDLLKTWQRNDC